MTNLLNLLIYPLDALIGIDLFKLVLVSCLVLGFVIYIIQILFKGVFN